MLLVYGMQRKPEIYPDPEAFKPERFQFNQENKGQNTIANIGHPYAFIPFSAGQKNFIGQKYAMLQLKVVLSWVLRKFKFSLPPNVKFDEEIDTSWEVLLLPVGGMPLIISPHNCLGNEMIT